MAPDINRKIVDLPELMAAVGEARSRGASIVQCHGCFDIVHPGHVRYLQFARRQGDLLLVSLTGDSEIDKGDQRPYIPQELRAENLAALEFVDLVYIDPNETAAAILEAVKPDIYVKGAEYESSRHPAFLRERGIVEQHGGRVIFSSGDVVFSSTQLIQTIGRERELESQRLQLLYRRHDLTAERLSELVDRFAGLRVLVVGDIVSDRYVLCDALDVASESPVLSLSQLDETTYLGGAAIVARHAAAMGAEAVLLSAVADDDASREAERALTEEGVSSCLIPSRRRLPQKTRFLVDDQKVLKVEAADHEPLDSIAEQQAAAAIERELENVDAVIFCDFGYGMITNRLLGRVLPVCRARARVITADVSGARGSLLNFQDVDLLCPTERELRATLHDFDQGLSQVAWDLLARTRARHLFVTLGKEGVVLFDRRSQDPDDPEWAGRLRSEHLPTLAAQTLDKLGCGDAMLTAATLALAAGAPLLHSGYLGSAAAALELASMGNIPIGARGLRDWLEHQPDLHVSLPQRMSVAV